jgi:hypothetical protein
LQCNSSRPTGQHFDQLVHLTGGRFGISDVICPECSTWPSRSAVGRRRKVLRVWRDEPNFLRFNCQRCGLKGHARDSDAPTINPVDLERQRQLRAEAERRDAEYRQSQHEKALRLWGRSVPIKGTIAEAYLRNRNISLDRWPPTLRFLPPLTDYHPAMIAAFAIPNEPEPGVLINDTATVCAVHLTLLKADGSDKADTQPNKIIIASPRGAPVVIAPPHDTLAVTEGIEEALTVHIAMRWGVWAAGSASHMPALADAVPSNVTRIVIIQDDNESGRRGSRGLAQRLRARGLSVEIKSSARWEGKNPTERAA